MATITRYIDPDADAGGNGTTTSLTGANCCYKSLTLWEAARNVGTLANIERGHCLSQHTNHTADAGPVAVTGSTASATNYPEVYVDPAARCPGVWDTSKFRIACSSTSAPAFEISQNYARADGVWARQTGNYLAAIRLQYYGGNYLSNCAGINDTAASGYMGIFVNMSSDIRTCIWNCIGIVPAGATSGTDIGIYLEGFGAYPISLYSCFAYGYTGVRVRSLSATLKNCFAVGRTNDPGDSNLSYQKTSGTWTLTNCASIDGTGGSTDVAWSTSTITSVTDGSLDARLVSGSALVAAGADFSGDGAPLNFTDDMAGVSRAGVWDIGPLKFVFVSAFKAAWAAGANQIIQAGE